MKNIDINFSEDEALKLSECLSNLRKMIDLEYQNSENGKSVDDGIYRSACELQYKVDKAFNPDLKLTLDDYLDVGK